MNCYPSRTIISTLSITQETAEYLLSDCSSSAVEGTDTGNLSCHMPSHCTITAKTLVITHSVYALGFIHADFIYYILHSILHYNYSAYLYIFYTSLYILYIAFFIGRLHVCEH